MPGFDRTGPLGMGPRSGGGRGFCGPGVNRYSAGIGWFGRGRGLGRGLMGMGLGWGGFFAGPRSWRRGFFPGYNPTTDEEASVLKGKAASLKEMLGSIEQRLRELEKRNSKE
ncbi:MAG: DUF5320 domain-containing protein [Thermodesulfobacteriota bacterium]